MLPQGKESYEIAILAIKRGITFSQPTGAGLNAPAFSMML